MSTKPRSNMETTAVFNLAWVASVVGFFLPLLISFLKRAEWSTQTKRIVALATSVVAGIITVGVQLGLNFDEGFLPAIALAVVDVYVVSSVTYGNFWKDTAIERGLESVGSNQPPYDEGYNATDEWKAPTN